MKDDQALRVHARLTASPLLRPFAFGEGRRFGLWDLASLTEGALGPIQDPDSLTVSSEKRLRRELGPAGREYRHDDRLSRRYWIRSPGECGGGVVGTVAVDTRPTGADALSVSSLHVRPAVRRSGLAGAVLNAVYEACRAEGLHGFRLEAYWTWQEAVRYYLGRGLWVTSWKHALGFARLSFLPDYEVREEGGELVLYVGGEPLPAAGADGRRLLLRETAGYRRLTGGPEVMCRDARARLALHLAVGGRPLVRGEGGVGPGRLVL